MNVFEGVADATVNFTNTVKIYVIYRNIIYIVYTSAQVYKINFALRFQKLRRHRTYAASFIYYTSVCSATENDNFVGA